VKLIVVCSAFAIIESDCLSILLELEMSASESTTGLAPGVEIDRVISLVNDHTSQSLFRMLFAQQRYDRDVQAQGHSEIMSVLQSMAGSVARTQTDVAQFKKFQQQYPPAPTIYPEFVHADDRTSSSTSGPLSSSSSDVVLGGPLQCPFCPASHTNEKSHVQHMNRIPLRLYECNVFIAFVSY
jgi:hypothetical protein